MNTSDLLAGDFPRLSTIREKYGPAMAITDQAVADAYLEKCVRHSLLFGNSREQAESVERSNLGYFAGYCDHKTRTRVERLFYCSHPIFGSIADNGPPTTEQAFEMGFKRGA